MKDFINALNRLGAHFDNAVSDALDEIAEDAQANAKASTLFKGSSLRNAIKVISNGQLSRTVLADKDYAGYVEYGNNQEGPYIYPKKAKCLHFWANGNEVFTKKVRSHGPLPFMQNARDITINKIPSIISKHLRKII